MAASIEEEVLYASALSRVDYFKGAFDYDMLIKTKKRGQLEGKRQRQSSTPAPEPSSPKKQKCIGAGALVGDSQAAAVLPPSVVESNSASASQPAKLNVLGSAPGSMPKNAKSDSGHQAKAGQGEGQPRQIGYKKKQQGVCVQWQGQGQGTYTR